MSHVLGIITVDYRIELSFLNAPCFFLTIQQMKFVTGVGQLEVMAVVPLLLLGSREENVSVS